MKYSKEKLVRLSIEIKSAAINKTKHYKKTKNNNEIKNVGITAKISRLWHAMNKIKISHTTSFVSWIEINKNTNNLLIEMQHAVN